MLASSCLRPLSRTTNCPWARSLAFRGSLFLHLQSRRLSTTPQKQYRTAGLGSVFVTRSASASSGSAMSSADIIANTPRVKLNNGVEMPLFGLGTSGINGEECTKDVHQAVQLGYRVSTSIVLIWMRNALKHICTFHTRAPAQFVWHKVLPRIWFIVTAPLQDLAHLQGPQVRCHLGSAGSLLVVCNGHRCTYSRQAITGCCGVCIEVFVYAWFSTLGNSHYT